MKRLKAVLNALSESYPSASAIIATGSPACTSLFAGQKHLPLADKRLSLAITAMHADPARRWTLRDLGMQAGMLRSVFALRFKELVRPCNI
jgi:hypothetical protein